jgi:DNA-binding NarL/FixJ family response regulator
MRVLLVDDSNQAVAGVQRELRDHDIEVVYALDPLVARRHLYNQVFDAVIVDILYLHLTRDYAQRIRSGLVSLSGDHAFHVSGLVTIDDAYNLEIRPAIVIWTIGDANRELHLLFAYQYFGVRAFCSKGPSSAGTSDLRAAIEAAVRGRTFEDPLLRPYMPRENVRPIHDILFQKNRWRGVWRALALGIYDHRGIAKMLGIAPKTVRNTVREMADQLIELNPLLGLSSNPSAIVSTYAASNWEFFLDDTVMGIYPADLSRTRT